MTTKLTIKIVEALKKAGLVSYSPYVAGPVPEDHKQRAFDEYVRVVEGVVMEDAAKNSPGPLDQNLAAEADGQAGLLSLLDEVDADCNAMRRDIHTDSQLVGFASTATRYLLRLSRELRQRIEREQKLVSIVQNAADGGCLRGRRGHCAELESDSSNWCVPCQAAYLLTRS